MTSSGTYDFELANADVLTESFDRCGIRIAQVTRSQMTSATRSLNLELQSWANMGPNRWLVSEVVEPLIQGVKTYDVPQETVFLLSAFIRTFDGNGDPTDRIITGISVNDYSSMPNKFQEGLPTVYWFDRLISPTITLWEVPDNNGPYELHYYRVTRPQDAAAKMGQTPDIPYRFIDALCAGVAVRLARKYMPSMVMELKMEAKEALELALEEDRERVPLFITPDLSGYWRT